MSDVLVALIGAAGLVVVALISQRPHRKAIKRIDQRTKRELENNTGSSMKDDIDGMAYSIGKLQRDSERDRERVDTVLAVAAIHHPEHAHLYLALRSDHDEDA